MNQLLEKYFNDIPTSESYCESNIFYPPANPKEIDAVERYFSMGFPKDYRDFLCTSNGFEGQIGKTYGIFIQAEKIAEYTKNYGGEFFPWVIFIGTDGGNEMFVIDRRNNALQFGILPYIGNEIDFIALGNSFEEFVKRLYNNDFWKNDEPEQKSKY